MGRGRIRGLSMIETLFSLFFISATLLLTSHLLIAATRMQQEVEKALGASHLADQLLARIRANAALTGNPPAPSNGTDSRFPAYRYKVEVTRASLYSPCSSRELQFPAGERRIITNPGRYVKVTVSWDPPQVRNRAVAYGLILDRLPNLRQLNIDAVPSNVSPVTKDASAEFVVNATDTSNNVVDGLFFHWYCQPQTGNGLVVAKSRDGQKGQFTHIYKNPYRTAPTYFPAGTRCNVVARTRYNGKEFECTSPDIDLSDI